MPQRVTFCVLLLLICGSLAAEPINKPAKTAAVHSPAAPKETNTTLAGPANVLFGSVASPAPLAARAIGSYARGCLAGGVSLPINGPDWQVMRLSRNRNWVTRDCWTFLNALPMTPEPLMAGLDYLSATYRSRAADSMITGHASHQIGLDVDIWLTPMPDRILTPQERENMSAVSMLKDPFTVDSDKWTPLHTKLINFPHSSRAPSGHSPKAMRRVGAAGVGVRWRVRAYPQALIALVSGVQPLTTIIGTWENPAATDTWKRW